MPTSINLRHLSLKSVNVAAFDFSEDLLFRKILQDAACLSLRDAISLGSLYSTLHFIMLLNRCSPFCFRAYNFCETSWNLIKNLLIKKIAFFSSNWKHTTCRQSWKLSHCVFYHFRSKYEGGMGVHIIITETQNSFCYVVTGKLPNIVITRPLRSELLLS